MKTRLLKISFFIIIATLIVGCCEDCEKKSKADVKSAVSQINTKLSQQFSTFRDIKLPIFLGKSRNQYKQHLHIEGGIENPFFIVGKFDSEISTDKKTCTIKGLELEILTTRQTGAKIKSYEFDTSKEILLYRDSNGQLKISATVMVGSTNKIVNAKIDTGAKDVKNLEIIDITITKKGFKADSKKITLGNEEYTILCCEPVICKSIVNFP